MQNEVDISLVDLNLGRAVISPTLTDTPVIGETFILNIVKAASNYHGLCYPSYSKVTF